MKYTALNINPSQLKTIAATLQNLGEKVLQTPSLQFIPVDLALPPEGEPVLVYMMNAPFIRIAIALHDGLMWWTILPDDPTDPIPLLDEDPAYKITHWSPLPQPKYYPVANAKSVDPVTGIVTDPDASFPSQFSAPSAPPRGIDLPEIAPHHPAPIKKNK